MEAKRMIEGYSPEEQQLFDECVEKVDSILRYGTHMDGVRIEVGEYTYDIGELKVYINAGFSYWSDETGGEFMGVLLKYSDADGYQTEENYSLGGSRKIPKVHIRTLNPAREMVNGDRPLTAEDMREVNSFLDLVMADPEIRRANVSEQLQGFNEDLRQIRSLTGKTRSDYGNPKTTVDHKMVTLGSRYDTENRRGEWVVTVVEDPTAQNRREYDIVWDATTRKRGSSIRTDSYVQRRDVHSGITSTEVSLDDTAFVRKVIERLTRKAERVSQQSRPNLVSIREYAQLSRRAHELAQVAALKLRYEAAMGGLQRELDTDSVGRLGVLSKLNDESLIMLIKAQDDILGGSDRIGADLRAVQAIRELIQSNQEAAGADVEDLTPKP